ncbi:MAG: CRTAC1 family protein [Streptosporangiaceae bacterium]|nr:CRTAC1 family protein [Streptosporangiaceae bacterium]
MPLSARRRVRKYTAGISAVALVAGLFYVAREAVASVPPGQAHQIAAGYKFKSMPIAMPAGYHPKQTVRQVNPAYAHLRSWISSVGAGIALTDLTGRNVADDLCIVDPRTDSVIVTYAPTAPASDRFTPFILNPAPLPMDSAMAPMGCAPGDFNGDGRMDLLVYYWGRTPIVFLARAGVSRLSAAAYKPTELVPAVSLDGKYNGPRWNTNSVNIADYDGDGHPDILIGNYFPDSDVLNPQGLDNVVMNSSMSNARNGGGDYALRWDGATAGSDPSVRYVPVNTAIPYSASTGWTLAISSADLTGNGLPDAYIANDFGPDHLLYNRSTPGHISFTEAVGQRTPTTPKSFVLGKDSFKGMGTDFADLADNGRFDILVSNIGTSWGLEESNFVFMNQARSGAQMQQDLANGFAPFDQQAEQMGMAWTGWGWDVKTADFRNSGELDVVQTDGFVKGSINRWPWLQEMAMTNDDLYTNPATWPNVQPGDDIAGHQALAFYAKSPSGRYVNISSELGLAVPTPTRGIAIADTQGDGALDFAVARQWAAPAFYANQSPDRGHYLGLWLYRPPSGGYQPDGLQGPGSPAYGATARIVLPGGHTQIVQLDGGGGHSGKRSFEVYFGLGSYRGPVPVQLQWRDMRGHLHRQTLSLTPGTHDLVLTSTAQEVSSR